MNELRQVARLSRWLDDRDLSPGRLNRERIEEFLAFQRANGRHRSEWSRPGLCCLLEVLENLGELDHEEQAGTSLAEVAASDVTGALRREAAAVSVAATQNFRAGLRAFLRFCFTEGLLEVDLSGAALAVTGWRCRLMWARRSLPTCDEDDREATGGKCSCGRERRSNRSRPARSARPCAGRVGAPESPRSARTGCATLSPARW